MKWLLSLAALVVVWTTQARAEVVRSFRLGPWSIGVYADSAGKFSHCASGSRFNNDITLLFSVSKDFVWTFAFHNKEWGFERNQEVAVTLTLDNAPPIKLTGEAFDRSGIVVTLDDDADLFRRFRTTKRLKISGVKKSFEFELTRMNDMFTQLLACAKQDDGSGKVVAQNPFMTTKKASAELAAEATAFAANLLSEAKVTDYRFLAPEEIPKLPGDARWQRPGKGLGSVRVNPDIDLDAQRTLIRQLVAKQARACEGKFGSGYLPDDDKGPGSAFVMCDIGEATFVFYYFTMPRVSGGAYLVTTSDYGAGAVTRAKEEHQNFREAAFATR